MKRTIAAALCASLTTGVVFAGNLPNTSDLQISGAMINLAGGYINNGEKQNITDSSGSHTTNAYSGGGFAQLGLGYQHQFNQYFVLGGEFIGAFAGNNTAKDNNNKNIARYWAGLQIQPGIMLANNAELYANLGGDLGNFRFKRENSSNDYSKSSNLWGGHIGIGIKLYLAQHVSLDMVSNYYAYQTQSVTSGTYKNKIRPRIFTTQIGLGFHFW